MTPSAGNKDAKAVSSKFTHRRCCTSVIMRPACYLISPHVAHGASWVWDTCLSLTNGQNFFAKFLFKWNNLCGRGSCRIFALLLPQKKDHFHCFRVRLHIPGQSHCWKYFDFNQLYLAKGKITPVALLLHEAK